MYKTVLLILFGCISMATFSQSLGNSRASRANSNLSNIDAQPLPYEADKAIVAAVRGMEHVTIAVNGLYNVKPDGFLAIFNMVQTGKTTYETDSIYQSRYDGFVLDLFRLEVDAEDVYTDFISFLPLYEVEKTKKIFGAKYEEVPKGFEMQKNIHVRMTSPKMLDKVISAAARQGIYDLVTIEYFVNDQQAAQKKLRDEIQKLVKTKEEEFKVLDIPLDGKWRMVGDTWDVHYPVQRYKSYTAKTRYSLDAVKEGAAVKEVRVPKTQFYSKVDYNAFDIVLNAQFVDPAVQFTYSLIMEYEVKRPKPEPEPKKTPQPPKEIKQFILITADGKTRVLDL